MPKLLHICCAGPLIACLTVLPGCSNEHAGDDGGGNAMAAHDRDAVWAIRMQDNVRKKLKDPESATFRDVQTFHGGGVPAVCGQVNSKNSFGGKSGFQRFIAAGDLVFLDEEVEGGLTQVWSQFCK